MAVLCFVPDLIMRSKIDNAARHYDVPVRYSSDEAGFHAALADAAPRPPLLVCIDLDHPAADGVDLVKRAREAAPDARIVGFCSHVMTDLIRDSRAAGASTVMPNSNFSTSVAGLVAEAAQTAKLTESRENPS